MEMEVALGSRVNARGLLELLDVNESTKFLSLLDTWGERSYRVIDYHSGPVDEGADFLFYDPSERRRIDQHTASNRASATRVVHEDMLFGWCNEENDTESTPPDESRGFYGYVVVTESLTRMNQTPNNRTKCMVIVTTPT